MRIKAAHIDKLRFQPPQLTSRLTVVIYFSDGPAMTLLMNSAATILHVSIIIIIIITYLRTQVVKGNTNKINM